MLGCQALAGLEGDFRLRDGGADAAGGSDVTGGMGGSGQAGAPGCVLGIPPARPDLRDDGDIRFVVALREVDLREDSGEPVGFDLDGRCTCGDGAEPSDAFPSSCSAPPGATAGSLCDAEGGVDGQSAHIFGQFSASGFDSTSMSLGADAGYWSVLIEVTGYNGQPDDPKVAVNLFNALPLDAPAWEGADLWPIDPDSLEDGVSTEKPRYRTETAFVRSGKLVMSLDSSALVFRSYSGGHLTVRLQGSTLVAEIASTSTGFALRDSIVSGKWSASDIFNALDSFRLDDGSPVCTDNPLFALANAIVCSSLDVNAGSANIAETCDAISFGLVFQAEPAGLGAVGSIPELPPGCPSRTLPSTGLCSFL